MPSRLPRPGLSHAAFIIPTRPGGVCFFTQSTTAHQSSREQIRKSLQKPPVSSASNTKAPVPYVSFQPGPSNIPDAPLAVPSQWLSSQIRAADKMVLYRGKGSRPEFLYSARRFLELPRNTLVPEVCLLGRSNVGKSTMINAIAGMPSAKTGNVNKTLAKKGLGDGGVSGLAVTSRKAGCTQTLNCYGFGPAPSTQVSGCELLIPTRPEDSEGGEGAEVAREVVGGRSRSEVREDAKEKARNRETHNHSLYIMDMPGYGHNSREEWGNEIVKYIQKRKMLKGAVLLIDAAAGFKEGDRVTLQLLRDAQVRTAVVLTKGNKAILAFDPAVQGGADLSNDHPIVKACAQVWGELRRTEREVPQQSWTEGNGWERDIFVTAAHSSQEGRKDGAAFGLSGVRLALCNMAGLISGVQSRTREPSIKAASETKPASPSKIVSFDEIMWAPTTLPASGQSLEQPAEPEPTIDPFEAAFGDFASPNGDVAKGRGRKRKQRARAVSLKGSNDAFTWGDEEKQPAPTKSLSKSGKSKPRKGSNSRGATPVDSFDAVFLGSASASKVKPKKGGRSRSSF
ncbi:hypothetical protein PpBr36_08327 [Pyricularia pennisetigena]|uniref:hypothetical protein n=1 Tax=Pyricularia pennisetigena TaxID=1578925 RepID=UPI0011533CF1|nr:hypothetical protein PpBr36_08327 [Pyricularia pennisetigena]TLS24063.1 hypothetical protein PpBr36_08327 [Pyricularia pennisetigena]